MLPIAHVDEALREEDCVVIDHKENVVKVLLLGLQLKEVHAHRSDWSQEFDVDGVVVSVPSTDGQLEGVEEEKDSSEHHDCWDQQIWAVVVLGDEEVAWEGPDSKGDDLVKDDAGIDEWVKWNASGSSHGPSEQWISKHAVDEKSWEVP